MVLLGSLNGAQGLTLHVAASTTLHVRRWLEEQAVLDRRWRKDPRKTAPFRDLGALCRGARADRSAHGTRRERSVARAGAL